MSQLRPQTTRSTDFLTQSLPKVFEPASFLDTSRAVHFPVTMQPPFPSPSATWHNKSYAAIDPSNPNLSQIGKTVIITGAGSGIGRATALAFAEASAAQLVLTERTESTLRETEKLLGDSESDCMVFPVSATDETAMQNVAEQVDTWDVLVLAVAQISSPSSSGQDWWADYEMTVKAIVIASRAFVPNAKSDAALYTLAAGAAALQSAYTPGRSAYFTSKVAQTKIVEFLAAENPDLLACESWNGGYRYLPRQWY